MGDILNKEVRQVFTWWSVLVLKLKYSSLVSVLLWLLNGLLDVINHDQNWCLCTLFMWWTVFAHVQTRAWTTSLVWVIWALEKSSPLDSVDMCVSVHARGQSHMWPWTTKPVLSRWGIFAAIGKNTLHCIASKLSIFVLCQKSVEY